MEHNQLECNTNDRGAIMPDITKITVLLADEDALRRDGLAAVLRANEGIEVVGGCPDGQAALDEIRETRPDVAVVDLNLPGLHGIELVRRVRGESLGTKVVILSGTTDDEIVREVVRAGADAYLLKNGPARHLVDAINYVRDGGQYFSPQLHRDGRDRHLLEEPARVPPEQEYHDPARAARAERRARPRRGDSAQFRERLRTAATSQDLRDHDYDVMTEMADGIRPILDRLDEIEERIVDMESGDAPVPAEPREWLSDQLTETLRGSRGGAERGSGRRNYRDVEAQLPQMIDEAVSRRFSTLAGKLQEQIEEQHVKTLETFVKNIQVKLVQRVSALEQNMQHQSEAMLELREYNQRTEDNLGRLISGVDKLAQELPKRLAAARASEEVSTEAPPQGAPQGTEENVKAPAAKAPVRVSRGSRSLTKKKILPLVFWALVAVAIVFAAIYGIRARNADSDSAVPPQGKEIQTAKQRAATAAANPEPVVVNGDTKTKLEAAAQYVERKEYASAEDIYRQVIDTEPQNVDALKGLASVLYREGKLEESAAILDRIPRN